MNNVMIDIETVSAKTNAVIAQIAAVKFEFGSDKTEKFIVNVDMLSSKKLGMHIDKDTLDWWKSKPDGVFSSMLTDAVPIDDALDKLLLFIGPTSKDIVFWCQGLNFDIPILNWSHDACNKPHPWKYWNLRDTRTIFSLCDIRMDKVERIGTYHNALDDCYTQIKYLKQALS